MKTSRTAKRSVFLAAAVAALAAALYLPAARFDFIDYDEREFVVQNPRIREGLTVDGIQWAFTTPYASHYIPLTWLSFMADVSLHGMDPGGFHLSNIGLHAANAALLFAALMELTGAVWPSALTAALFAVHPLNVESVAWVYERKGLLSAFFCLLTLLAYARYVHRPSVRRYFAVAAFFLPALLSKPLAISLPAALLLLDWWPLGRLARRPKDEEASFARQVSLLVLEKVPLFLMSAVFGAVLLLVFRDVGFLTTPASLGDRAANAMVSYALYLWKTIWPARFSVVYLIPKGGHPWWHVALAAASLAGISLGALVSARRRPYLAAGWLWYLGIMFPTIGLLNTGIQAMADRHAYLPLIGLFLGACWHWHHWAASRPAARLFWAAGAAALVMALGAASARQLPYWRNSTTLFGRAIELNRDNWMAWYSLGTAYLTKGRYQEAADALRLSVSIEPGSAQTYNNLGAAEEGAGRIREAEDAYREALRIQNLDGAAANLRRLYARSDWTLRPREVPQAARAQESGDAEAYNNLGAAEERAGRVREAEAAYRHALAIRKDFAGAAVNLGMLYLRAGQDLLAIQPLRDAAALEPGNADALLGLGLASYNLGRTDDSVNLFERVLVLRPGSTDAWNNLGAAREKIGRLPEAVEAYRRALDLDPGLADTWYNLGLLHDRLNRPGEAADAFSRAVGLRPGDVQARSRLADALIRAGDFSGARGEYEALKNLDPAAAEALRPRLP